MFVKQISVFVENKPGRLMAVSKILKDNNIDIKALSIADTHDFGILRIVVDDTEKACQMLKNADCTVKQTDVLAIGIKDEPGGLFDIMNVLYDNQVSVEYVYAFARKLEDNTAFLILRPDNKEKALSVLQNSSIKLLSADDIKSL